MLFGERALKFGLGLRGVCLFLSQPKLAQGFRSLAFCFLGGLFRVECCGLSKASLVPYRRRRAGRGGRPLANFRCGAFTSVIPKIMLPMTTRRSAFARAFFSS